MPPKTNQQRIKDLEGAIKQILDEGLNIHMNNEARIERRIDDLLDAASEDSGDESTELTLDERFENHAEAIQGVRKSLEEHTDEPDAHNPAFLAREAKIAMRAAAKAAAAAKKEE